MDTMVLHMNVENNQLHTDALMILIQLSLWENQTSGLQKLNGEDVTLWNGIFAEMKTQAIAALPARILPMLSLPPDLYRDWETFILQKMRQNLRNSHEESRLPSILTVPYVILKGTSAAQYYPHPEFRTMGDIDIMTSQEDHVTACEMLLQSGYQEITSHGDAERGRHRAFRKDNAVVEMHIFFASMNDEEKAQIMDRYILDHINEAHALPDLVNGLVLIEHINQHLENGLGLRQTIDWMMFVDKCLSDENWPGFQVMAAKTGMEMLAITMTRMCEIYLGLPPRNWSAGADEGLCAQLMEYILACGDFGSKQVVQDGDHNRFMQTMAQLGTPAAVFANLQEKGLMQWKAAQRYAPLRPFAWLYQTGHYLSRMVQDEKKESGAGSLREQYMKAKQYKEMLDALGVKQAHKGLVGYSEGKYEKRM